MMIKKSKYYRKYFLFHKDVTLKNELRSYFILKTTKGLINFLFSDEVREKMKGRYLSNPDYNFEKVNRASLACGPMVKWAIAQVNFIVRNLKVICIYHLHNFQEDKL